jgi:tyrosine-protein phosphatase non-receptor type 23
MDKLTEATKLAKKVSNYGESINDAVSFTHDVVGGKLKAAEKENEFVYHEKVPERSALPEIKGASLVKGNYFSCFCSRTIFYNL